jgi:hypothetical protein
MGVRDGLGILQYSRPSAPARPSAILARLPPPTGHNINKKKKKRKKKKNINTT